MPKISVIITAFKERKTIGRAIKQIEANKLPDYELIIVAPDEETLNEARKHERKNKKIKTLKDSGKGKPAALNLAISKAQGDILVLTDGDVFIGNKALGLMIDKFKNKKIGAVSGRPISINDQNTRLGFWSYLLTEIANERRTKALRLGKRFFCSGYLFAMRKKLFPKLPKDILSEDGFISHKVYEKGYKIGYSPDSKVYVKYPLNFKDWIKQKKRSAGGYSQIRSLIGVEMRSFRKEGLGSLAFLKYVSGVTQALWLVELYLSRIYLWRVIHRDIIVKKKTHGEIWERVESTK